MTYTVFQLRSQYHIATQINCDINGQLSDRKLTQTGAYKNSVYWLGIA